MNAAGGSLDVALQESMNHAETFRGEWIRHGFLEDPSEH